MNRNSKLYDNSSSRGYKDDSTLKWIELVLYLSDLNYLDNDKIDSLYRKFPRVTIAGPGERPPNLAREVHWYSYSSDESRSSVWNYLLGQSQKEWTLFIEDDEQIQFGSFPDEKIIGSSRWIPSLVQWKNSNNLDQYYQIRLVYGGGDHFFEGYNLPDSTQYIRENEISLLENPLVIKRKTNPLRNINIEEELALKFVSPKLYLVQGARDFDNGRYIHAAAQYRQLLKTEKLLPFDRLAGVNGLASCLAEQFKWSKAVSLAQESVDAEPLQNLPYLIQFRIFELQKQWKNAYSALSNYYAKIDLNSKASFDKALGKEETLLNLADMALKAGMKKRASNHFNKLFSLKKSEVERSVLHRVLLLSIELSDYERSIHFFRQMFEDQFPDNLDENQSNELNDFMTMFMQKGWYEFVSEIYDQLYLHNPQNREYKRRLIVALTKINKMEEARELIVDVF